MDKKPNDRIDVVAPKTKTNEDPRIIAIIGGEKIARPGLETYFADSQENSDLQFSGLECTCQPVMVTTTVCSCDTVSVCSCVPVCTCEVICSCVAYAQPNRSSNKPSNSSSSGPSELLPGLGGRTRDNIFGEGGDLSSSSSSGSSSSGSSSSSSSSSSSTYCSCNLVYYYTY